MKRTNALRLCMGFLLLGGCMTLPGTQNKIAAGARLEYAIKGSGRPVVVFESGLGDGMDSWGRVFAEVSGFATAFAYNRPGYGNASRATTPRDGVHVVEELRDLLTRAGLHPPYLLVGHSLGGTYQQLFARLHPEEVAGLVLVEARAESMTRRCREARIGMCDPPHWLIAALPGAAAAEFDALDATFQQLRAAPLMAAIPLRVLTSTQPRMVEGPAWTELWLMTQAELAAESLLGEQITTGRSGHYIQKQEPALVVDAIRALAQRAR